MKKQYFEFQEDNSSKFWEIELDGTTLKTRYGKIGTDGKATEKSFDDAAAATKEYDKLVKEKTKKGYAEPGAVVKPAAPAKASVINAKLITDEEAKEQFDLDNYDPFGDMGFETVLLLEGDTVIVGDLNQDWTSATLKSLGESGDIGSALVLVNGNLTVEGDISPSTGSFPFLLVLGNVKCDVLHSYDECIYITGDADIRYAFNGNYNDGSIVIDGTTRVPYVLNSDHSSELNPEGAILINYYGDYEDFFEYDYTTEDFERVMVSAVYNSDKEEFNVFKFIELVKAGKSPFKKGAMPGRLIVEKELAEMEGEVEELNLASKKLKSFPKSILKLTTLKKLILTDNSIESIPEEIAELVNLEELYLNKCGLEELPEGIGKLAHLSVLNVSGNPGLVLPDAVNQLSSLRELNISYNTGFGFPASVAGLKQLEILNCYQCSTAAPIDFPKQITELTGLKKLLMGSVSIKTIPAQFLQLTQLEELNLNASLCYLNSLPDLSVLKNLKVLRADGLISYTTRPHPEQSLLKSFFTISSLEELYIDRHGEDKEAFVKKEQQEEIKQNLAHDPARWAKIDAALDTTVPNSIYGDGRAGIVRPALTASHLEGISNLKYLRVLDLSFNDLSTLPEELLTMTHLRSINLRYNRLPVSERLRIGKALVGCIPDFRDNKEDGETVNSEEVKLWHEMNALIKQANTLMFARNDRDKLLHCLPVYDQVLEYFSTGKVVDEYNNLYANYGKIYAYSYLTSTFKNTFSKDELEQHVQDALKQGVYTLSLIPNIIWQYTDIGKFHEEITRIASNTVAWLMYERCDKKEELEEALSIIEKGVQCVKFEQHFFIYDTQVRILLKMGNTEEAYRVVKKKLAKEPGFADFADIKKDKDYKAWLKKQQ